MVKKFNEKTQRLWQITEDSLKKSMKIFNIDLKMKNELLDLYRVLSTYPEVREVLENLKNKNFKLAILSNGTPSLLNELVKSNNLNDLFDDLFSIEEVKIYKPDSRVYDIPVKRYKIKPEDITFLSANTWDVSGGEITGIIQFGLTETKHNLIILIISRKMKLATYRNYLI